MTGSVFLHMITRKRLFSQARNYPTFYERLMQLDKNETTIPELAELPHWVWPKVGKMVHLMLAPEWRGRRRIAFCNSPVQMEPSFQPYRGILTLLEKPSGL
jgi:hypothetical protein